MSGILDNKTRILDTIVTSLGREQLANGGLQVSYVSFSDAGTVYSADANSGSTDATQKAYLESSNLPQDQITFKSDDVGKLQPFKSVNIEQQLVAGQLISYSFTPTTSSFITGSNDTVTVSSGDDFSTQMSDVLKSSIDNFQNLRIIGTHDNIFDDGFAVGPNAIEFVITDDQPLTKKQRKISINSTESLFNDPRLSRLDNFKYLPPIEKLDNDQIDKTDFTQTSQYAIGNYPPWGRTQLSPVSVEQIQTELAQFEKMGCVKSVSFEPTSHFNNVIGQFFEINYSVANKLDIIDFGILQSANTRMHVFFIGKILVDDRNRQTFVHVFTLVFE